MDKKALSKKPETCLLIGGSGYIGSKICRQLNSNGIKVVFSFLNNETKAKTLESELSGVEAVQTDLTDSEAIKSLVHYTAEKLNGIDILIQCGGTAGDPELYKTSSRPDHDKFLDIDENEFDNMMNVTVKSTFFACQEVSKIMRNQGGGNMIIVGSMDGLKSVPAPVHYAAAKGALVAMVKALAKDLGKYQICVNLIAPGILEGGLGKYLTDELKEEYVRHCSLNRLGKASEISSILNWLALHNTYVTGQSILVDGAL
jgi:3-oxoacyl-[acyl-carrier protein] reductase